MEVFVNPEVSIEKIIVGEFQVNCYIITERKTKITGIIDPGADIEKVERFIKNKGLEVKYIINTHGHFDHILGDKELKSEYGCPVIAGKKEFEMLKDPQLNLSGFFGKKFEIIPDKGAGENDIIEIGGIRLLVKELPGHTPGSIILIGAHFVFSGDTLFSGGVGRTDFAGGNMELLLSGIREKLFSLPEDSSVFPGHGPVTTVKNEKKYNHFLS